MDRKTIDRQLALALATGNCEDANFICDFPSSESDSPLWTTRFPGKYVASDPAKTWENEGDNPFVVVTAEQVLRRAPRLRY